MSGWQIKYSDAQRTAIIRAYCDLRIRPATEIKRMAAAGELTPGAGETPLEPFEVPASTVIDIGKRADRRKRGEGLKPELRDMPARDRAQALQLRLTALADAELTRMEDQVKRGQKPLEAKDLQGMARVLRELATLPDPHEKRLPSVPGQVEPDGKQRGATRSGLAASIIAAADQSTSASNRAETSNRSTANTDTTPTANTTETTTEHHGSQHHDNDHDDNSPCLSEHAAFSGLAA